MTEAFNLKKIYFPNLDALRFCAFLFVFFHHGYWDYILQYADIKGGWLDKLFISFLNGGTGVSFFFVLSGFLITYLLLEEKTHTGTIHVIQFYSRRVLRIWPLYFALLIFTFIIYPFIDSAIGIQEKLEYKVFYHLLFLSNFDILHVLTKGLPSLGMINITWSVSIEEQFYLIWPLLFFIVPTRFQIVCFLGIIAMSTTFRLYQSEMVNYFHTVSVSSDLAIGGLCAYCIIYFNTFKSKIEQLPKVYIIAFYLVGFVWFVFVKETFLEIRYLSAIVRLINASFFAFIILEQNFSIHSFYKGSKNKLFSFWGKYTYGLYLLHPVALLLTIYIAQKFFGFTITGLFTGIVFGTAGLLVSLFISWVSYESFEIYFLKLKDKFSIAKTS